MRLDVFLCDEGLAVSRTEAKGLIQSEKVIVNGKKITKPAFEVIGDEDISVDRSEIKFVSRGGLKLEAAIDGFKIDPTDRMCIDVGASSGGFTDCLLQRGAAAVIAVDSGYGQMVQSLRDDARVTVIENYNARYMKSEDFEYIPNLAVMDVSFISATYIIPRVYELLSESSDFICLIKPQFEVGRAALSKGGIVKDEKYRKMAIDRVCGSAKSVGFDCISVVKSDILGGDGNIEYLAHFRKNGGTV